MTEKPWDKGARAADELVDALACALYMSVTAPTDEQSDRALKLADQIASRGLSPIQIEKAKKIAEQQLADSREGK